jgi:hypothetical protein
MKKKLESFIDMLGQSFFLETIILITILVIYIINKII